MKEIILAAILATASIPAQAPQLTPDKNQPVTLFIVNEYKVKPEKITKLLKRIDILIDNKFPTKSDVLAIIAIESSFKEEALSKHGAKGLMQILYTKTKTQEENLKAGIWLLKEYRYKLGSEQAAIHAYNIGIGNYLKGKRAYRYHKKFLVARTKIENAV